MSEVPGHLNVISFKQWHVPPTIIDVIHVGMEAVLALERYDQI